MHTKLVFSLAGLLVSSLACGGAARSGSRQGVDPSRPIVVGTETPRANTSTGGGATLNNNEPRPAASLANVKVSVTGLKAQQGVVCYSLFAGADGFPDDASKVASAQCVNVTAVPAMDFRIEGLAPGTYAMALYHDKDSNGELNKAVLLGIPTEGIAFSNGARVRLTTPPFGPPSFSEAAFVLQAGENSTSAEMVHLMD